jgi:hypothetical protein
MVPKISIIISVSFIIIFGVQFKVVCRIKLALSPSLDVQRDLAK